MSIIIIIVAAFIALKILGKIIGNRRRKTRRNWLLNKYNDVDVVNDIMSRYIWQGQTAEQLLDSRGTPVDIDSKVLKSKTKEVWKYYQVRKGQFRLRITLENDVVVGWEEK